MNSSSYVARTDGGYAAVLAEQLMGVHERQEDAEADYAHQLQIRHTFLENACTRVDELRKVFSHTRPNGEPWHTAIPNRWTGAAMENLAHAPSFDAAITAWLQSPPHREVLMTQVDVFGYCQAGGYHAALGWRKEP